MAAIASDYIDIVKNTQAKSMPAALSAALAGNVRGKMSEASAKKVSEDFESVFLAQMMQTMFPEDGEPNELFGSGEGDEVFRGMMVDEYAKQISKSGGIGIAGYIQRELLGTQEHKPTKPNPLKILTMQEAKLDNSSEAALNTQATTAVEGSSDAEAIIREIFQGGML